MNKNETPAARGLPVRHVAPQNAVNALVAGTEVWTLDGALPAEFLTPGDRIITRDAGAATLVDLRHRRVRIDLVQIARGTLGASRPDRDAILPAAQEVLVRDWRAAALFGASRALVPAARLVDGTFVRHIGTREVDLIGLVFDAPHVLYADGLEVASDLPVTACA